MQFWAWEYLYWSVWVTRWTALALRYEDAYIKGPNGSQAAWASCKYQVTTKEMVEEQMRHKYIMYICFILKHLQPPAW